MKKLFIVITILGSLVIANILTNTNRFNTKKVTENLSDVIFLDKTLFSFEIINKGKKIKLIEGDFVNNNPHGFGTLTSKDGTKKESCYKIKSINYCADDKKVQLLKKFLTGEVKDTYENTKGNLNRLGFTNENGSIEMVINSNRTLLFGNINQYNEVYVSQLNKIYKVDYFEGVLETFTGHWINKSNPILPLIENDEFDIEILNLDISKKRNCASISHKELVNDNNFSTLRNAFFDLYASDIKNNWKEAINARSQKMKIVFTNSITKKIIFDVIIWKKDHLVYLSKVTGDVNFVIPNSVYDNVSIYCKK